ncbi:hypothetical protein Q3G72_023036 [Acer saccharum]|nr:hypothetical protein Q3G72_023036 [Acer saccharum]
MTGADYQECNIDIDERESESIEHLLIKTYREDICKMCFNLVHEDHLITSNSKATSFSFYRKAAGENVPNRLLKRVSKGLKMRKLYLLKKKKMEELLRQSDRNEELLRRSDRNEELLRRSALGGDFDRDDIADQIRKRRKKNPND